MDPTKLEIFGAKNETHSTKWPPSNFEKGRNFVIFGQISKRSIWTKNSQKISKKQEISEKMVHFFSKNTLPKINMIIWSCFFLGGGFFGKMGHFFRYFLFFWDFLCNFFCLDGTLRDLSKNDEIRTFWVIWLGSFSWKCFGKF